MAIRGTREVSEVAFYDIETGEKVLVLDTMKVSGVSSIPSHLLKKDESATKPNVLMALDKGRES